MKPTSATKYNSVRLITFTALYNMPICNYIKFDRSGNGRLNVLICGDGEVAVEAFKGVFWCGQFPKTSLTIDIVALDNDEFEESMNKYLPAIKDFCNLNDENDSSKHFGNIRFISANDIEKNEYDVAFFSYDDEKENRDQLLNYYNKKSWKNTFIYIYSDNVNKRNKKSNYYFYKRNVNKDLIRMGTNVNLSYTNDSTKNIKEINEQFLKDGLVNEINCYEDKVTSVNEAMSRYIGKPYNLDSSIASALYTPYRLKLAKMLKPTKDPMETLIDSINERDELYSQQVILEHVRWMAYTITRGYRYPREGEFEFVKKTLKTSSDVASNSDLKTKDLLLHLCLCESENDKSSIRNDLWNMDWKESQKLVPHGLDWASLYYHHAFDEKCKTVKAEILRRKDVLKTKLMTIYKCENDNELKTRKPMAYKYLESITKLVSDSPNSIDIYETYKERMILAFNGDQEISEMVKVIDEKYAGYFIKRNKKINFLSYDEDLVKTTPFNVWFRDKYEKIYVIASGNIFNDAMVPYILSSKKAFFIIDENNDVSDEYESIITNFYQRHGKNVEASFIKLNFEEKSISTYIKNRKDPKDSYLIYLSGNQDLSIVLNVKNAFEQNVPIILFDRDNGIYAFNKILKPCVSWNNKKLTVDDYIMLMGAEHLSDTKKELSFGDIKDIEQFYFSLNEGEWTKITKEMALDNPKHNFKKISIAIIDEICLKISSLINILVKKRWVSCSSYEEDDETIFKLTILQSDNYVNLFGKAGNLFEIISLNKWRETDLFDTVQNSVEIQWTSSEPAFNEIDLFAINKNASVLISCKDRALKKNVDVEKERKELQRVFANGVENVDKKVRITLDKYAYNYVDSHLFHGGNVDVRSFLYEIKSEADLINAYPVIMVGRKYSSFAWFASKAKAMGVSVLDLDTIKDDDLFKKAVESILNGHVYSPKVK